MSIFRLFLLIFYASSTIFYIFQQVLCQKLCQNYAVWKLRVGVIRPIFLPIVSLFVYTKIFINKHHLKLSSPLLQPHQETFDVLVLNTVNSRIVAAIQNAFLCDFSVLMFNDAAFIIIEQIARLFFNRFVAMLDFINFTSINGFIEDNHIEFAADKVRDVQMFLNSFMTKKPEFTGMVQLKEPLPKKVSFRELDRENIIPRSTSYYLNHREGRISKAVATKICEYYNLEFDDYFDEIVKIKQYSQETIKGYRRVLRTIFNEAVRFEWITKNPVCGTKVSAGNSNTSLRPVTEKAVFSIAETKEFLKAIDSLGEEHINNKIMIKLMLLTGIRNAELHGLRWSDIDFEKKLIHIKRNRLYSKRLGTYEKCPKTKTSERDIPLSDGLIADLKVYMDWFRLADDEFDNKLDNYYLAVNIMREPESVHHIGSWLKKFEERNGFKAVTCHGLRHTYCSMLLSQNVPIQTVSKYMGHSDSSITLQVYSHFIPDTQEKVVNAINLIESEE